MNSSFVESSMTLRPEEQFVARLEMETTTDGLRVGIRSAVLSDFWEKLADKGNPIVKVSKWGGAAVWNVPTERLPTITDASFATLGEGLLLNSGEVNLAFLRLVDIDKGVEIKLKGLFPPPTRRSFRLAFMEKTRELYIEYIRPVTEIVTVTCRLGG